ncbi:MAG: hypothetical protein ACFWT0_07070 [Bifidobacterium crudilactis]|jgi:hypothetical protein
MNSFVPKRNLVNRADLLFPVGVTAADRRPIG